MNYMIEDVLLVRKHSYSLGVALIRLIHAAAYC